MNQPIQNALEKLEKKEAKQLSKPHKPNKLKEQLNEKIPEKVSQSLETAFVKAFETVFCKGTGAIEKTFDREERMTEFEANDYILGKRCNDKNIRRFDRTAKKSNLINRTVTTTAGLGLGFFGIGLPDIPFLVSTILRGIYETALSYGYDYTQKEEQIYILRLIRVSICHDIRKKQYYRQLIHGDTALANLQAEIQSTASLLSEELLVEKFIQGIPIVGVMGAFVNSRIYKEISHFSGIQYKKRYLVQKERALREGK